VEQDIENLRAALRWALSTDDAELALTLVDALAITGSLWTPPFGGLALEAAEMTGAVGHRLRVTAMGSFCLTLTQQGEVDAALEMAGATERLAAGLGSEPADRKVRCRMTGCLSTAIAFGGDLGRLVTLARLALADARAIGDQYETARALIMLAGTLGVDEADEAIAAGEEALILARQVGNPSYLAWAPMMLAGRLSERDPGRAERLLREAVEAATVADNEWAQLMAMQNLAVAQSARRDHPGAARTLLSMAQRGHVVGDHGSAQSALFGVACLLARLGDEDTALLTAAWVAARGHTFGESFEAASRTNHMFVTLEAQRLFAARSRLSPAVLAAYTERASGLDEGALIDLVQARASELLAGGGGRDGPDERRTSRA
jgi:hypothetical protein